MYVVRTIYVIILGADHCLNCMRVCEELISILLRSCQLFICTH